MKVAFQMDPIGSVDIDADSTFRLAEEAQARGCSMWHYTPDGLSFREGRVVARAQPLRVKRLRGDHARSVIPLTLDLADMDVVWLRQDPPFDMGYITTTHILDRLKGETLVVNDPFWVRNSPEKLLVLDFPDLTPPTMIARDLEVLARGLQGQAWRHHPQAALRQRRRGRVPARSQRPQPRLAA
jgi:glutathione synthase